MGGYNSGRWGWHSKKIQVEDCVKLTDFLSQTVLAAGKLEYCSLVPWWAGTWEHKLSGFGR